jgi:NTP pyrophosphatase (non-canonical NTP hydrolase)
MSDVLAMTRSGALASMQAEVREVNEANGWYEEERTVGEDIALLHSEVSEMLEAYRDHGLADATDHTIYGSHDALTPNRLAKPEGFGSECADVLIRLLDTCDRRGIDLVAEFERKVAFNRTRGYKHGGKRL